MIVLRMYAYELHDYGNPHNVFERVELVQTISNVESRMAHIHGLDCHLTKQFLVDLILDTF